MNRLTNILNRASVAPSDSTAASPARDAATPAPLVRSKGARNLNLPAPVGKREKAKRLLGAAFSVSAKPTELAAPVMRHGKPATSKTALSQPVLTPTAPSPTLQDRLKALRERPTDTGPRSADLNSNEPDYEELQRQQDEEKQYYNWK